MLEDKCFSSFYIPSMSGHMFLYRRFFFRSQTNFSNSFEN